MPYPTEISFTTSPAVQESGNGRGTVLSNGIRVDGQTARLDGTLVDTSHNYPDVHFQVEVRSDSTFVPFHFEAGKQYAVTITEVV